MSDLLKFGPRGADVPPSRPCPACHVRFAPGDFTTLITLGPGGDPEEREKAATGRAYNAVALEVHWECATGEPADPSVTEKE